MRVKLALLYESEKGKTRCEAAAGVLTAVSLSFGHTFALQLRACPVSDRAEDAVLGLCVGAQGILCGDSGMRCLPDIVGEMGCLLRARELRGCEEILPRPFAGLPAPLETVVVQSLQNDEKALTAAAEHAMKLAEESGLDVTELPPNGKISDSWMNAMNRARAGHRHISVRSLQLPQLMPELLTDPAKTGILLCPPYAGSVAAPTATLLSGSEGMKYEGYYGGDRPIYAALDEKDETDAAHADPFGMLRCVMKLLREQLKMEKEASCVEAAVRNVLMAGWRSPDIADEQSSPVTTDVIVHLICEQIELAGEWIKNG